MEYKVSNGIFNDWLNKLEPGKFRQEVIGRLVLYLYARLENQIYDEQYAANLISTNGAQKNSIIRTIILILYHKNQTEKVTSFNLKKIIYAKDGDTLKYDLIFQNKKTLPLEHLLEIAPYIYSLEPIKKLNLSYNLLETLPETIYALSDLEKINLICNNLKTLPQNLLKLTKLKKIEIDQDLYAKLSSEFIHKLKAKNVKITIFS
jgi:hypothetical protein